MSPLYALPRTKCIPRPDRVTSAPRQFCASEYPCYFPCVAVGYCSAWPGLSWPMIEPLLVVVEDGYKPMALLHHIPSRSDRPSSDLDRETDRQLCSSGTGPIWRSRLRRLSLSLVFCFIRYRLFLCFDIAYTLGAGLQT